ncbi:MAG: hypothetical protein JXR49_05455 [Acidobacteria bacterium]|nr:hypothetical protein [Acidobacteriota bacterium]
MQDSEAFEHAVSIEKLHELIPELNSYQENLPDKDPNIYRPMALMEHMFEAIRQTFGWVSHFGIEEYKGSDAKRYALLWINTALLFHDMGEIALIKGTNLPLWYRFTVEWTKKKRRNILRETYPFFGMDTPEGRSYIDHLKHPEISAVLAADPLLRLGWDSRAIKVVQFLIRNHSVLIEKATYGRLKDGRVLHEDLYKDLASVYEETGVAKEDLLKMLQVVQIMDAKAVKSDMAQIPQETMMRVWIAHSYMNVVLTVNSSPRRCKAFKNYRKLFNRIRKEMPFGTSFNELYKELLRRIEEKDSSLDEEDKKLLEQELEYFEIFEIIREDHIHINNQFNQLLHLIERRRGKELSAAEKAVLLQAYKIAYRSHDGQFRRAHKIIPTGDKRRKYIEHPIKVAKIMVELFGVTDPLTLTAVLLHDVLEDTDINVEDILAAFKNDDAKGRIIRAITILTKPESRKALKGKLYKDLAYLTYLANILTAGDTVLNDRELFKWLRFVLPRIKAADKIHNRRTLMARKPTGRIKEICRNGNTLVMLMEASNLTPEEKLKVLKEFDKSFFEIFNPLDFRNEENVKCFQESLSVFRQFMSERFRGIYEKHTERQEAIREFDNKLIALPQYLGSPVAVAEKLKDMEKTLPHLCRKMGLGDRETSAVMDEFTFFLFNASEVQWLTDEGKRKIIGFQTVVHRYKEKINKENWEPKLAGTMDDLARYAQGDENVLPPIVRFGWLPDISELLSKVPFIHCWYDRFFVMKKRDLLARLLPRAAMLPLRHIYWLEGNEVKSIDRVRVEREIGGLSIETLSGRIVVKIHPPLAGFYLRSIKSAFARNNVN